MTRRFRAFFMAVVLCLIGMGAAQAERRLAFVVGIDTYANLGADAQLQRAVSDADAVGDTLAELDFIVTRLTKGPTTQEVILRRFSEFAGTIEPGDLVLFYFSGHGVGLDGSNYLLPSDIPALQAGDERLIKARALAETDISGDIRAKGARVVVLVLDSCRNDPFTDPGHRSLTLSRGLARVEPASGTLTIYAASAGRQALDRLSDTGDPDPNSVFTRVFIRTLKEPGLNLSELGDRVRDDVAALARSVGQEQVPAVSNEVVGARQIFLAGRPDAATSEPAIKPAPGRTDQCNRLFDAARSIDTAQAYQAYLDQCQGEAFVAMAIAAKARLVPPADNRQVVATRTTDEPADRSVPMVEPPTAVGPTGPSFDCLKARGPIEHAVCNTPGLGAADRMLDGVFKQVASGLTANGILDLTKGQGVWLRQRGACQQDDYDGMVGCIQHRYEERIAQLRAMLPASGPAGRITPSFDCGAARSTIEKLICGDQQLADRDRKLSVAFAQRLQMVGQPRQKALAHEQMAWWATRESCMQLPVDDLRACVLRAYDLRLRDLGGQAQ